MSDYIKILLLISALLVVALTQQPKTLHDIHAECMQGTSVTENDINKLLTQPNFQADTSIKCFLKCVDIKLNIMDSSGNINEDGMKRVVKDILRMDDTSKLDGCSDVRGTGGDPCETAYVLYQCVMKARWS